MTDPLSQSPTKLTINWGISPSEIDTHVILLPRFLTCVFKRSKRVKEFLIEIPREKMVAETQLGKIRI